MQRIPLIAAILVSTPSTLWGDVEWTGWLGPDRTGWVKGFQPPTDWPKALKKSWTVKVGTGYGSPLVSGGQVYQHARQGEKEVVWCFDLKTGTAKWKKDVATPFKIAGGGERHGKGPKSCPAIANGRLFTLGITGVLTAWDAATGKQLWQRDYSKEFKVGHPRWGASTSPIVDGNRVIMHFGTDGKGALVALNAANGNEVWRQGTDGPSYSSPLVVEIDGTRQVIDWNEKSLAGVESKSGKLLWKYPAPQTWTDQNMPTPTFHNGQILLGAENRGIRCLAPKKQPDGTWKVEQKWHQKKVALDMSTAVINNNLLFGMSHFNGGRFFCLQPKDGKILWQGPPRTARNITFLAVPGYVLALINHGELQVLTATRDAYHKVASYRVSQSQTWAPPVLLPNGFLVKDHDTLTMWALPIKR